MRHEVPQEEELPVKTPEYWLCGVLRLVRDTESSSPQQGCMGRIWDDKRGWFLAQPILTV